MSRYAERTSVPKDRSLAEIEHTLTRYGASGFIYGWSGDRAMVGFVLADRQYKLTIPMPDPNDRAFTHTPETNVRRSDAARQNAYDQAVRQRWRALALYIKATLEAVAAGIISLDDAFLAYTALPGGSTVGQWLTPQIAESYRRGTMPPLLPLPEDTP